MANLNCDICNKTKDEAAFVIKERTTNVHMIGGRRYDFTNQRVCTGCYNDARISSGLKPL